MFEEIAKAINRTNKMECKTYPTLGKYYFLSLSWNINDKINQSSLGDINESMSSTGKDFDYMSHLSVNR